jgi:1,4-alpha-glucan branching enzyme
MMQQCVIDLNELYRKQPALHELQFDKKGCEWVNLNHRQESVVSYLRKGKNRKNDVLIILNFTPVVRRDWKLRIKGKAAWKEIFNSDQTRYWGTGNVFNPSPEVKLLNKKTGSYEINVHLPALGAVILV